MYFLPLFIYGLFNEIVDSPDNRMAGWLMSINRQNMFKNAAILSFQFATPWNRAQ
jgi:hypothetical protein